MSGPATRHILERAHKVFGQTEYARLAEISVAHLYNLRNGQEYRRQAQYSKQPGQRRCQSANGESRTRRGRPGFLCVDTVTQWEVIDCVSRISEAFLMPVLEAILPSSRSR